MRIHITFKDNPPLDVTTSRVTMSDTLTPGQVSLVLGTRGGEIMGRKFEKSKEFQYYPILDITSFWVEED